MKRKIVQHGPSTLTVSLPAAWVRDYALKKGDEISVERTRSGLLLAADKERSHGKKRINVSGFPAIIPKTIAALYKCGYDEIIIEFDDPVELERIHTAVSTSYVGFEIIEETKNEVIIKRVSEPSGEEFKSLFRRIFHFLRSTAEEGLEAATRRDTALHQKLVLRDKTINKLTTFCRRTVNKGMQQEYEYDTALYHVLEQLEKIGDDYRDIHKHLMDTGQRLSKPTINLYHQVNALLAYYEDLFFSLSLEKVNRFFEHYEDVLALQRKGSDDDVSVRYFLYSIARELYNLSGVTMMLHL